MKRIIHSCFLFIALFLTGNTFAQVFWTETFGGAACNQGNLATAGVPTASNGAWAVTALATGPGNGAQANAWFISATENGNPVGSCGTGCGTNHTLHMGSNIFAPFLDPGAAYLIGAGSQTNKRAESPVVNCTGQSNITMAFKYLANGNPGSDFCEALYFDGAVWNVLGTLAPVVGACTPQGSWTPQSYVLPASANNNAAVRVGFRWQNGTVTGGPGTGDPSVAVDDITLSQAVAFTFTTPLTACSGQTANATVTGTVAGATTYTWGAFPAGPTFAPATGTQVTITYPTAGTFSIVGVALNGLVPIASATQVVVVSAGPTLAIAAPSQTICTGASATLTANASAGSTFQWFNGATALGTASTEIVTPAATTVYSVIASIGTCTAAANTTVVVGNFLAIAAGASSPSVCPGSAVTLTANGATSYTWVAPPSTTISTTSSAVDNPTIATTYTVFASSGTCNGMLTVQVGMTTGLTLTVVASSATVCPGQTTTLSVTGGVNYTWSPGTSLSTTSGSVTNASPNVATTYTVLGDNGAGCNGSAQITINMGSSPPMSISSTASAVCTGFNSTLTATGATSYTWSGTTLTTSVVQPSISVGPGTYTVFGGTGAGCNSFSVVTVNLAPPLNVQVTQSSFTTCMASNYPQFSKPVILNATGASIYSWSQCNPAYMTICIGPTVTVRPPTSTCYTVTGSTSVCSGSAVVCVTVIPQFTMAVTPQQPIMCIGDSIKLATTGISSLAVLPIPSATNTNGYVWHDPLSVAPSLDNPLAGTVIATPSITCTYTFEIFDARACVSLPRLITVTVLPQPLTSIAIPTINNVATNTVCFVGNTPGAPDNTLTLTGSNNNAGLPFGVVPTYTWASQYTQAPCNSQSILTPINNNSVIVNAPCRLPGVTTYTLISGYNGIPGCRRQDTVSVRAIDCRPVRNIQFTTATTNDTICARTCVTFLNLTDTMAGGPQTYTWTFPGGAPATSSLTNPTICYNLPGIFNVILTVANPYDIPVGSILTTYRNKYIKVVDIPNVTIVPPGQYKSDTIVRFGKCVTLTASGAASYIWSPNYKLSNSLTAHNVTVCPLTTTQYILTGYNSKNCFSSDTINVIVVEDCGEMFVPNAFSPNGDGANDILYVRGECLESLTFMVFNRWGQKVFETTDKNIGWDGTFNGDMMNTGVFVFRLEGKDYEGKGYSMKGNVTLIR
ncbi:MAG: gliding motility-associated C-terminal domain-containing protein [Bacteroidota bacterium]|nr:gliding motility-associated C-terminal domain-containing protein [Bacteroidota bacterium]MDP3146489.1 gliding motility-associated C-terminal domain-containing protein [Bacteroidota bacterium]MDP3557643.1 gliding motility-associated C-terminal domain-containing protein [Bacteroidota bacterium]